MRLTVNFRVGNYSRPNQLTKSYGTPFENCGSGPYVKEGSTDVIMITPLTSRYNRATWNSNA